MLSQSEAAGNSRREREIISFYPCPSLSGLILKSLRHGDVTAGPRAAARLLSDDARDAELSHITCPAVLTIAAAVGARVNPADGLLLLAAAPR